MAKKSNIRSIRFSDDIRDMIEQQAGENFNQKFENLVTRAFWDLPAAERELKRVKSLVNDERQELYAMKKWTDTLADHLSEISEAIDSLSDKLNM